MMMRRREFIAGLAGAAAWPIAARAQQPGRIPRVGYLVNDFEGASEVQARRSAFRSALERSGWVEDYNIRIEYRWGVVGDRLQSSVAELIRLQPDVIVAEGSLISDALRRETRSIAIVFVNASDPQASGLVQNMAHPGGNLTGFANYEFSMGGKWLEVLKEIAPKVERVLIILGPRKNLGQLGFLKATEAVAPSIGVKLVVAAVDGAGIEPAIQQFNQEPNGGILVLPGTPGLDHKDLIIRLAAMHQLPAIYPYRFYSSGSGLISYDTDAVHLFGRAALYVDRILRGERPADLPVQLPTKYDLVVNLKTAKALGLDIPPTLLARADEVIE